MFKKVMELITTTTSALVGGTGYLDLFPWGNTAKGADEKGRPFFVMPVEVIEENQFSLGEAHISRRVGMCCFFKRYSDPSHPVWVTASSHISGGHAKPVLDGALRDPDNMSLEAGVEKALRGETVEFIYSKDWNNECRFVRRWRILTPAEVQAEVDKMERTPIKEYLSGVGKYSNG